MGEFIELIGQLKPKNNGNFPIADVNDLKGGYIQLDTVTQLNEHTNTEKVKQGMLAYVAETNGIYQHQQGLWIPWIGGSGGGTNGASIIKVGHLTDLENTAIQITGQIVYIEEIKDLRYFDGTDWKSFTRIYIQPTPPDDIGGIWIDTSDEKKYDSSNGVIVNILQSVSILQEKLRIIEWSLGNQLDFGDFSNNHYENYDDYIDPIEPVYGSDTAEDLWKLSDNLLSIIDEVEPTQYKSLTPSQINFSEIFKANIKITNASNLFAVTNLTNLNRGLLLITSDLLRNALQINNISGMFYYNTRLSGSVPLFQANIYTALNSVSSYLTGVNKNSILNADLLEPRLIPLGWN